MGNDNIIEVKNLTKSFKSLKAVDNISFEVEKGEIFAFLGPNGAGKSTTIKMLTTLLNPTSGTMLMNGFDPVSHPDEVRKTFGIVFQDPSIDEELTAYENMVYHGVLYDVPREVMKGRIEKLLKLRLKSMLRKQVSLSERQIKLMEYIEEYNQIKMAEAKQVVPMVSEDMEPAVGRPTPSW